MIIAVLRLEPYHFLTALVQFNRMTLLCEVLQMIQCKNKFIRLQVRHVDLTNYDLG